MADLKLSLATPVFYLASAATVARGIFEGAGSKSIGYIFQLACVTALFAYLLACGRSKRQGQPWARWTPELTYALVLVTCLSAAYVSMFLDFWASWTYVAVMTFFIALFFVTSTYQFDALRRVNMTACFAVLGIALVLTATAQQQSMFFDVLPGSDHASIDGAIRPASLTGSYLHYPLIIAIFCLMLFQAYASTRRLIWLVVSGVLALAVVLSFSRSGVMILLFAVLMHFVLASRNMKVKLVYTAVIAITVALLLAPGGNIYFDRVISAVQANGAGNGGRFTQWGLAVTMWENSPLLIGGYTGMITNVTRNFSSADSFVVESGFLQQLLSFGLIGVVLFYALFVALYRSIDKNHSWLRAMIVAAALQSFIYQSIEVFPFMVILALAPLFSDNLRQRTDACADQGRNAGPKPVSHGAPVLRYAGKHHASQK